MVVLIDKLLSTDAMFKSSKAKLIGQYAPDMNKKHKDISIYFLGLEKKGIPGNIIDELMLSVLIIWYVVENCYYKKIEVITESDITSNVGVFYSLLEHFCNINVGTKELSIFLKYEKDLLEYAIYILKYIYKDIMLIPKEVIAQYLSIVKCFEDKLEYTRKRKEI